MPTGSRWSVQHLTLENFRCFTRVDLEFDPYFTALVGVNGVGKTAILDGLAVMLSTVLHELGGGRRGFSGSDVRAKLQASGQVPTMEPQFPVRGTINAVLDGTDYWWWREKNSENGRTGWGDKAPIDVRVNEVWEAATAEYPTTELPVIALYGVERLVGVRKAQGEISRSRRDAYTAALDGKSDLTRLSSYVQSLIFDERTSSDRGKTDSPESRQLSAIRLACERVLSPTGWHGPDWRMSLNELTLTHPEHGELPLSQLSSGIKITAGLAIDLASRMAQANPALGGPELLKRVPGIVLIDEIDLHLHPTWQQRIVPSLRSAFPNIQFIATTHSPQVLSTVPAEQIRVLEGDQVSAVAHSEGLRSDVVLRQVMATEPQPDIEITRRLRDYLDLVDDGRGLTDEAKELRAELNAELGGAELVPALADADAAMTFYDLDDE